MQTIERVILRNFYYELQPPLNNKVISHKCLRAHLNILKISIKYPFVPFVVNKTLPFHVCTFILITGVHM